MLRRLAAVLLLASASFAFAARFRAPPQEVVDVDVIIALMDIEPTTTQRTYTPLPSVTTTTQPPLPPGIRQFESGYVQFGRGTMQLRITLDLWELVDIEMIRVPSGSERARTTNLESAPILAAEAIEVQGYRLHVISGATETSYGYMRALRDAFQEADFCAHPKCDLPLD